MNITPGRVSIVVLNWNSGELGERAVASALAQDFDDVEVVVVDNASSDDSMARISALLGASVDGRSATIVGNPANLGFAQGMNAGIEVCTGEFVLPLNCDAELAPNYVSKLVSVLDESPRVAAAGGLVKSVAAGPSGPLAITRTMRTDSLLAFANTAKRDGTDPQPMVCDKVNGACPLFRHAALGQVIDRFGGPYDGSYDTYGEDVDLALTLGRLGWTYLFVPGAQAKHVRSYSSAPKLADRSGRLRITTLANRHRNIVRHARHWPVLNLFAVVQDIGFAALGVVRGDAQAVVDVVSAWRVHARWLDVDLTRRHRLAPPAARQVSSLSSAAVRWYSQQA